MEQEDANSVRKNRVRSEAEPSVVGGLRLEVGGKKLIFDRVRSEVGG
jgi:hypothetical protein